MAVPVGSMVEKFRDEFDEALEKGVPSANGNGADPRRRGDRASRRGSEAGHMSMAGTAAPEAAG